MKASVFTPDKLVFEGAVTQVVADTMTGSRCFLPRHIDCSVPLVTGIVVLTLENGQERFVAIDEGVLLKKGVHVSIASSRAMIAKTLEALPRDVEEGMYGGDEIERSTRRAMAQLETRLMKQFVEFIR